MSSASNHSKLSLDEILGTAKAKKKRNWGFRHITSKVMLFVAALLASTTFVIVAFFVNHTINVLEHQLEQRAIADALNYSKLSKYGVLTEDEKILQEIVASSLENPDVLAISMVDSRGNILAKGVKTGYEVPDPSMTDLSRTYTSKKVIISIANGAADDGRKHSTENRTPAYYQATAPVMAVRPQTELDDFDILDLDVASPTQETVVGAVQITLSRQELESSVRDTLRFSTLLGVALVALALFISVIIVRQFLDPILAISRMASYISDNELSDLEFDTEQDQMTLMQKNSQEAVVVRRKSNDEIGLLSTAFIRMSRRLKSHNKNLENFVNRRTRELNNSLEQSRLLRRNAEQVSSELRSSNTTLQLYQRCLEESSDCMVIADVDLNIITVNKAFLAQNNISKFAAKRLKLQEFIVEDERQNFVDHTWKTSTVSGNWFGEANFISKTNTQYAAEISIARVENDSDPERGPVFICMFRDITQLKKQQSDLVALANNDALTGLYNRRRFMEELELEIKKSGRHRQITAVIWIDLDQFKEVNDSLGHQAGDEMLIKLASILKDQVRDLDLVARLGGDEFAILVPNADEDYLGLLVERVLSAIRNTPVRVKNQTVRMTASAGIAVHPKHGQQSEELLAAADIALFESKKGGRNKFTLYSGESEQTQDSNYRVQWTRKLRDALDEENFLLYAQPIVEVSTLRPSHYELLLRMSDDEDQVVLPAALIELAERSGMIHEIDRWVIGEAVRMLAQHQDQNTKFALNLSAHALGDERVFDVLVSDMQNAHVEPNRVMIEITETTAIANVQKANSFISRVRDIGCTIALDDFGAGFSSFAQLRDLPADFIKLDGSFIHNVDQEPDNKCLIEAMVNVGRGLGKKTIAEWVENQDVLDIVTELGVDLVQGYHIAAPAPLETIDKMFYK